MQTRIFALGKSVFALGKSVFAPRKSVFALGKNVFAQRNPGFLIEKPGFLIKKPKSGNTGARAGVFFFNALALPPPSMRCHIPRVSGIVERSRLWRMP
ncbi:MAG: hypothetical protein LBE17_14335 [Treponema sp.]|nr:hypothetical protein [Treponema sp.]